MGNGFGRWARSFDLWVLADLTAQAPGMGSVSRFAVSHSPVPVIVVR